MRNPGQVPICCSVSIDGRSDEDGILYPEKRNGIFVLRIVLNPSAEEILIHLTNEEDATQLSIDLTALSKQS